jgi:hypothetical protein
MGTIIPPTLFGIDPDETWDYTPAAFRELPEAERPVFHLKAPDAALDQLMDDEASALFAAVRKSIPKDQIAELRALDAIKKDDRTEAQASRLDELNAAWNEAVVDAAAKSDRLDIQRRVLGFCVAGWSNLKTTRGKTLDRPKEDAKVVDSLSKALRAEIFLAIKQGMEITPEEKASLT